MTIRYFYQMKFLLVFCLSLAAVLPGKAQPNAVVVELFTSQGCSSCPAADKNLSEIIQRAVKDGNPIYGLSFHVDYWNYIGWKDPYSNKEFTERQRKYAGQLNLHTIYTPQMIVNGRDEFVGSNKSDAEESIKEALRDSPAYQIKVTSIRTTSDMVTIQYALDKDAHGELLNVAIVERNLENNVTRGENQGRKLHHDNVVRSFKTIQLKRNGEIQISGSNVNSQNSSVILYVQDAAGHVVAATSNPLSKNQ
jgi:hypothetical protein